MDCKQATGFIHDYLDETIRQNEEQHLNEHLLHCIGCRARFQSLRQTIAFMQSASHIHAPQDFTDKVMAALPKETMSQIWRQRMHRHPFVVAASLFVFLMAGSMVSLWSEDQQFQLSADQLHKLEIDEKQNKVIVPANSVVTGDIVIHNADLAIEGQVKGNVTVIDGHIYLASTGSVLGEREEVHQAVGWVWYNLKRVAYQLVP